MNGFVDDKLRALIAVPISATADGERHDLIVWIDTAFNGAIVMPRTQIAALSLVKESSAEAILADGSTVELETFACFVDWFGKLYGTQIIANEGDYALLGTMLLEGRRLEIDYRAKLVELT